MITPRQCLPPAVMLQLIKLLATGGPVGAGLDLATTEKETSNPSSLVLTQKVGPLHVERLVLRWKTSREEVTRAILQIIFEELRKAGIRVVRLCIDASNERFFAQRLQKQFTKFCPVQLVVSGENVPNVTIDGEPVTWKEYVGNLYENRYTGALIRIPDERWLKEDRRLVKREKGRFVADTSPDGGHADTFDAGKLAGLALTGRGRAEAAGAAVGGSSAGKPNYAGLRNPLLKMAQQQQSRRTPC
jgi:hypothetical protein